MRAASSESFESFLARPGEIRRVCYWDVFFDVDIWEKVIAPTGSMQLCDKYVTDAFLGGGPILQPVSYTHLTLPTSDLV